MADILDTEGGGGEVDDFDAAFAQATGTVSADETVDTAAVEASADETTAEATTLETPAVETPAIETPAAESTPAAEAPAAESAPAAAAEPQLPPGLDPRYLAQALAEEQAKLAAKQEPQAPAVQAKPLTADDFLDEPSKTAIAKFQQDWPDEFPAIKQMIKAEASALATNQTNALIAQLNSVLAPLYQAVGKSEVNTHMGTIRAAHSDLDQVLPSVTEWVGKQPAFLRAAYQSVLEKGTAQDVVDLVSLYKATVQTGAAPATPASSAAQEPKPAAPAKPAIDPAAVAATAAVPAAQRAKPSANADPNDFASAFAEAQALMLTSS